MPILTQKLLDTQKMKVEHQILGTFQNCNKLLKEIEEKRNRSKHGPLASKKALRGKALQLSNSLSDGATIISTKLRNIQELSKLEGR
jgi:hypothetical protein